MMKKIVAVTMLGLGLSTAAFAEDTSLISVLNYSGNQVDVRVFDADYNPVMDSTVGVNEKIEGHWFTPASWYLGNDVFDYVHLFYVDKTTGNMIHCGDLPGGDKIPWGSSVKKVYAIDNCDSNGLATFKWRQLA